jgi:chromosome segregation ATPase
MTNEQKKEKIKKSIKSCVKDLTQANKIVDYYESKIKSLSDELTKLDNSVDWKRPEITEENIPF